MACPLEPMGANIIVTIDEEGGKEKKTGAPLF
jgi:hypothetical protein